MKLTVLGCSGSVPGPASPASSYLVQADGDSLILDMGSGAFGALQRYVDPLDVAGICITHLHPDHCNDLCGYYVALQYGPGKGHDRRIPVWGPTGTDARMAAAYGLPVDSGMTSVFDFREYPDQPIEIGPFVVRSALVNHPVPAYALRIEHAGRVLTYSGDTAESPQLVELARDADLMLCEAGHGSWDGMPAGVHLNGREAGEHAAAAGAKHLVVTHIPPWCEVDETVQSARAAFGGDVEPAMANQSWEI